ncbi:MAG: hypothetical protein AB1742_13135 [bacterium]
MKDVPERAGGGILVAHVAAPQPAETGDFVYRVIQPDRALGTVPGFATVSLMNISPWKNRILRDADVAVLQMLGDPDLLPVVAERKRRGKVTVFEVSDNFFSFQETNPARAFYDNPDSVNFRTFWFPLHGGSFKDR